MTDRELLQEDGFEGFLTVTELRASGLKQIPECPGVHVILRESPDPPVFLDRSVEGDRPTAR